MIPLSQQAYQQIKHKIITLQLEPREVVDEAALREELDLGRTPIREALQRLEREQLVNIVPRRGIFVTDIDLTDLNRLFEMRIPLEILATRLAVQRGNQSHWRAMGASLGQATPSIGNTDLMDIDQRCHEIIYAAADNKFLQEMAAQLYALAHRLWHYALAEVDNMQSSVVQHEKMMDAIVAGDEETAVSLMETHIRDFHREIQAAMLQKVN